MLFALALVLFIGGVGVLGYQHGQSAPGIHLVSSYYSRITTWIAERRTHLVRGSFAKVKQLAAKEEAPPQIHFEFYTALPTMQVNADQPLTVASETPKVVTPVSPQKKTVLARADKSAGMQASKAMVSPFVPAVKSSVVNADELEQEFSAQIKQNTYIIQLGVFRTAVAAEHYRSTLAKAGFESTVVKTALTREKVYRVQLGPFSTKDQAAFAQRQIQKKGITGIVRKIELG